MLAKYTRLSRNQAPEQTNSQHQHQSSPPSLEQAQASQLEAVIKCFGECSGLSRPGAQCLKGQNILKAADNSFKLADFGLVQKLEGNSESGGLFRGFVLHPASV